MRLATIGAITVAGFCTTLTRSRLLRREETSAEGVWAAWLSWLVTFLAIRLRLWIVDRQFWGFGHLDAQTTPNSRIYLIKYYALLLSVITSQILEVLGVLSLFTPIITAAVYLLINSKRFRQNTLRPGGEYRELNGHGNAKLDNEPLEEPVSRRQASVFVALSAVSIFALVCSASGVAYTTSIVHGGFFVILQIFLYTFLPHIQNEEGFASTEATPAVRWDILENWSLGCFGTYTLILAVAIPKTFSLDLRLLAAAFLGAGRWVSIIILGLSGFSIVPSAFSVFAAGYNQIHPGLAPWRALLACVPSAIALWQAKTCLPKSSRLQKWIYLLMLVFVPPLFVIFSGYRRISIGMDGLHPIQKLVNNAQDHFAEVLRGQSTTLQQATIEYQRRYGREPPPNFDKWFELAMENNFLLVDEFDGMMRALEPFWGVDPHIIHQQLDRGFLQWPEYMVKYEVKDHKIEKAVGGPKWLKDHLLTWLPSPWLAFVPNVRLAINAFDEPSVCVARDTLDAALSKARGKAKFDEASGSYGGPLKQSPYFLNVGGQSTWDLITASCPADSPARKPTCPYHRDPRHLPFIRNATAGKDLCDHCELQFQEGFFFAPETLHITTSLFPIWSQGKPTSFNDITYPSPYYSAHKNDYQESEDMEWDAKDQQLYWVGAATGGHATEANWAHMQRQRFTLLTKTTSTKTVTFLQKEKFGSWEPYPSNMSSIAHLFSTRIMGITDQCDPLACKAEKEAFGVGDEEDKDTFADAYQHKFLFDMDGNNFSGRFYRLLQSKSCVLKQTVFEEWHDDRLAAWVHYIPITTSFDELPETMRFLTSSQEGDAVGKRIAKEGREWAAKTLREVDFQLVFLRLMMEYGRIIDVTRR